MSSNGSHTFDLKGLVKIVDSSDLCASGKDEVRRLTAKLQEGDLKRLYLVISLMFGESAFIRCSFFSLFPLT